MERHEQQLLERGVKALEKLAEDPTVEFETGPPICPNCGIFNPVVSINENASSGPLSHFMAMVQCDNCSEFFYLVPMHWLTFTRLTEVQVEIARREAILNVGNGQNSGQDQSP